MLAEIGEPGGKRCWLRMVSRRRWEERWSEGGRGEREREGGERKRGGRGKEGEGGEREGDTLGEKELCNV